MQRFLAVAFVIGIVAGCGGSGSTASPGPAATPGATAAAAVLARGTFVAKGVPVELDATGDGDSVTGTMTAGDEVEGFTVDLKCGLTAEDGRILIGGDTTVSNSMYAGTGARTVIVLKPGSPVHAAFDFERVGYPEASCMAFLEDVMGRHSATAIGDGALEPIEGTVELGP